MPDTPRAVPDENEDPAKWAAQGIDITRPSAARMYDYGLGGKDNFAVDRDAVEHLREIAPDSARIARENRGFLVRAVRLLAGSGIRQYIDLGTGIPTSPNVHEVARETQPDAKVVYVDNDPVVVAHNRARKARWPGVIALDLDIRRPERIIEDPKTQDLIDFSQPIGLLMLAVMHYVDIELDEEIMRPWREVMAPGSYLVLSTMTSEGAVGLERVKEIFRSTGAPFVVRDRPQIERLFDGFNILDPGLTDVTQWRHDSIPTGARIMAGVGIKR